MGLLGLSAVHNVYHTNIDPYMKNALPLSKKLNLNTAQLSRKIAIDKTGNSVVESVAVIIPIILSAWF